MDASIVAGRFRDERRRATILARLGAIAGPVLAFQERVNEAAGVPVRPCQGHRLGADERGPATMVALLVDDHLRERMRNALARNYHRLAARYLEGVLIIRLAGA